VAQDRDSSERIIRASEVGQYLFCARAWWLGAVQGLPSSRQEDLAAGVSAHRRHGRGVRFALLLGRLATVALILAAVVALIALWAR
jgi:CRISPR/Cas system-associated exonuclease Cas4 (RecB family)